MKRKIKNLAIAGMVGIASMGIMTACKKEDPKPPVPQPYIEVQGLDTGYIVGETLNIEDAKILYYSSKNDTTADEITLTKSMIANFSTEEAGNKTMKVLWNGFEVEIDYSVVNATGFINLYNTAYENFINTTDIHVEMSAISGNVVQVGGAEVSNNKYYDFAGIEGEEIKLQHWIQQENNVWYAYEIEEDGCFRDVLDMTMPNDNIMEYAFEGILMMENEELTINRFSQLEDVNFDIYGTKTILSFKLNGEEGLQETKLTIEDGKFTKVKSKFYEEDGINVEFSYSATISYNAEDVERVELPTDVQWEDTSL